jgi:mono/diheme cytochrome c family protein
MFTVRLIGKIALLCGILLSCRTAERNLCADDKPAEGPAFRQDVLPILEAKCVRCHGAQRRDGKLDLRTIEAMLTGGVTGPAIKPGDAKKSLLIELIHYNEMPPKKATPRVTKDELDLLRKWVDALPPK